MVYSTKLFIFRPPPPEFFPTGLRKSQNIYSKTLQQPQRKPDHDNDNMLIASLHVMAVHFNATGFMSQLSSKNKFNKWKNDMRQDHIKS